MGGLGSGRSAGWGRYKTEDLNALDVDKLHREGCLRDHWSGKWQWLCNGEQIGFINLRSSGSALHLAYRVKRPGEEWLSVAQSIQIVQVPCRYGGTRPYFLCATIKNGRSCDRRVRKLYGSYPYFQCRHCANLRYRSQSENQIDRTLRRADKLRVRLGGRDFGLGAFVPRKPKGMWRRTYTRLRDEVFRLDDMADAAFAIRHLRAFGP